MADQGTEGLLSPLLRARRIRAALPFLRGRVLDFGCGAGALAAWVEPGRYFGVDRDPDALQQARRLFPLHQFSAALPGSGTFDSIAALAVIEHLPAPEEWLAAMRRLLAPSGSLVITTPHPAFRRIHEAGARAGVFSREAAAEHETLFGRAALLRLAAAAGFQMVLYRRFLLGANQLAIFEPAPQEPGQH
jgi:SAM-dependent methyltransferase